MADERAVAILLFYYVFNFCIKYDKIWKIIIILEGYGKWLIM